MNCCSVFVLHGVHAAAMRLLSVQLFAPQIQWQVLIHSQICSSVTPPGSAFCARFVWCLLQVIRTERAVLSFREKLMWALAVSVEGEQRHTPALCRSAGDVEGGPGSNRVLGPHINTLWLSMCELVWDSSDGLWHLSTLMFEVKRLPHAAISCYQLLSSQLTLLCCVCNSSQRHV